MAPNAHEASLRDRTRGAAPAGSNPVAATGSPWGLRTLDRGVERTALAPTKLPAGKPWRTQSPHFQPCPLRCRQHSRNFAGHAWPQPGRSCRRQGYKRWTRSVSCTAPFAPWRPKRAYRTRSASRANSGGTPRIRPSAAQGPADRPGASTLPLHRLAQPQRGRSYRTHSTIRSQNAFLLLSQTTFPSRRIHGRAWCTR